MQCKDCRFWEEIPRGSGILETHRFDDWGPCHCYDSDHYGQRLHATHPACSSFEQEVRHAIPAQSKESP